MLPHQSLRDLSTAREIGAYGKAPDFGLIEVYGADAQRFLQAQSTNDVLALKEESSQMTCLLDRKAHVMACFELFRRHDSFRIIAETTQIKTIVSHLEEYRFADKVEFLDLSATGQFIVIEGPKSQRAIRAGISGKPRADLLDHCLCDQRLWGTPVHIFKKSIALGRGLFLWVSNRDFDFVLEKVQETCQSLDMVELTADLKETLRIEAGIAKFGVDFSSECFLPEAGLDESVVSYTKGCFLGQEVLARVRSQGAPTRGLMGLVFEQGVDANFALDTPVRSKGEEIGWLKSNCFSPQANRTVALASIKRDYRIAGTTLDTEITGAPYKVSVKLLPFSQPEDLSQRARRLYENALSAYAREQEADPSSPSIAMLQEVLDIEPGFEDAYETLGVILSKCGKLDEAIELMKTLAELNPESVMAHTNLSVFYVEKGMIEAAEEEKAISMSIRMKLAAHQAMLAKKDEEEIRQRKEEARDRMEMFKEVLSLDSEDLLANYGIGSCHVALEEYEDAIPYLNKAIELKPSYTVAYQSLGEAYEGMKKMHEAAGAYRDGIAVASKKGDMTPLKHMQLRLAVLETSMRVV